MLPYNKEHATEVVNSHCSPYRVTVPHSKPQQGKLTIKAHLIFEEYIGIDLLQKVMLLENKSNVKNKGHKELPYIPPSEKVVVIEDDKDAESGGTVKNLHHLNNYEMVKDAIFNLLDEDSGEGEPSNNNEEDECKFITEKTVFDHIREKAKNFTVLATSESSYSLAPDTSNLTGKSIRKKQLELLPELEVQRKQTRNNMSPQATINSISECKESEQNKDYINKNLSSRHHVTAESLNIMKMDDGGRNSLQPEESTINVITEETIFNHIRRKAKNFPLINKSKQIEPESFTQTEEISDSHPKFSTAASDINVSLKLKNKTHSGSNSPYRKLNLHPKDSSAKPNDLSAKDILLFDISMIKNNKRPNPVGFNGSSLKPQGSPTEPKRQCCSLDTTSDFREVDPYVAFKSVFSFL